MGENEEVKGKNYIQVSLPKDLIAGLDAWIQKNPQLGMTSRTDAVKFAVREMILNGPILESIAIPKQEVEDLQKGMHRG